MSNQRLYRSQTNKVFAGVCGGLADYFDVDPVIVRILFVLLVLFGGSGVVLYIAAIFIIPKKPFFPQPEENVPSSPPVDYSKRNANVRNWFGIGLVVFGIFLLLANMDIFHLFDFVEDTFDFILPVLLIILGMAIIYYRQSQTEQQANAPASGGSFQDTEFTYPNQPQRAFRRSATDKKLFGVCGGMAQYFGIDSSLIRMLYVILCLASFGAGLVLYILIAIIVPYDNVFTAKA